MVIRLKLFFAQLFLLVSSVSTEQSQICVMNTVLVMQERRDPCWQDNLTPSTEVPAQEDSLQKYKERVDKLSQQNRVIKFCTDAGFLTIVDVGQYFMTNWRFLTIYKTSDMSWVHLATRYDKWTDPKGWIRGNTKIGPVLEVTTSYLQGKYGVENRIESVNKDNYHSWVRISHGLNKLVTDLIDKEYDDNQTTFEEFALKTNVLALASRSKAKAKPQNLPLLAHLQELYLSLKEFGLILSQELNRISLTQCQKDWLLFFFMVTFREKKMGDWILENKGLSSERSWTISTLVWWKVEEYNGKRRRQQEKISILYWSVRTRNSWPPSSSRSFRTQSYWSFISSQDNMLILDNFFEYIYHIWCAINLHSITNSGLIPGGQKFEQRKTDSILYGCESYEQGA